jgi:hypothetical protein
MLYFDICEEVLLQFSQKFFRSYLFYGYLGLSRDLVANIRIRFISVLPLVRHCLRIPSDNLLLSKLIDSTESLAVRDTDGGVMLAMNQFYAKYRLLHNPECCQKASSSNQEDSPFESFVEPKQLQKSASLESFTDTYLVDQLAWESLHSNDEDKMIEEAEHKQLYFQLDPAKKKEAAGNGRVLKRQDSVKRNIRPSSMKPTKSAKSSVKRSGEKLYPNRLVSYRLESSIDSVSSLLSPASSPRKVSDDVKALESDLKKKVSIGSPPPKATPVSMRRPSKSAGITNSARQH